MAISEKFKLLNLNNFCLRKLCSDEVGGVEKNLLKEKSSFAI
jgi:hypothetical protein